MSTSTQAYPLGTFGMYKMTCLVRNFMIYSKDVSNCNALFFICSLMTEWTNKMLSNIWIEWNCPYTDV